MQHWKAKNGCQMGGLQPWVTTEGTVHHKMRLLCSEIVVAFLPAPSSFAPPTRPGPTTHHLLAARIGGDDDVTVRLNQLGT
uniref:Uncharacterized protein n=1 Tax=Ascaris lumbricoides TaxID=6252 RepID=A0A0M3I9Z1_ASCLU